LGGVVLASGILTSQLVVDFIADDEIDMATRLWLFRFYGDAAKASYTMFEVTFSGGWISRARPLVEECSPWFAFWWVIYQLVVCFSMIRIIGAIFLTQTMKSAERDESAMVNDTVSAREKYAKKIHDFFKAADTSGDGRVSPSELMALMGDPKLRAWLSLLEIETNEFTDLLLLLDDDRDGEISLNEFVNGCIRLKGQSRNIDMIQLLHEQGRMMRLTQDTSSAVDELLARMPRPTQPPVVAMKF